MCVCLCVCMHTRVWYLSYLVFSDSLIFCVSVLEHVRNYSFKYFLWSFSFLSTLFVIPNIFWNGPTILGMFSSVICFVFIESFFFLAFQFGKLLLTYLLVHWFFPYLGQVYLAQMNPPEAFFTLVTVLLIFSLSFDSFLEFAILLLTWPICISIQWIP